MNIFILDDNLKKSVEYHIDRHVVKMPLEAAQMISTVIAVDETLGYVPRALTKEETARIRKDKDGWPFYKPTHVNHPCNIWARTSLDNFRYLVDYCLELGIYEKMCRYPTGSPHKSSLIIQEFIEDRWPVHLSCHSGMTPFAQAMPDEYKSDDAIEAYRTYYMIEKTHDRSGNPMAAWTNREKPSWF